jgi:hypothetical protein
MMQEVSLYTNLQNLASILLQTHRHLRFICHNGSPAVLYIKSAGKMGTDEPPY